MNRKYLPLCIVLLVLFIQPKTALCQAPAGQLSAESDKWSLYVGLGMGYLPFQYDEFSPTTGGAYDERKVFSIMSIQVPVSVQYRRRYELEIRHFSVLQFGYYHPLENFSINTIGLGINPLAFLNEKLSHTFFIKINGGVSNLCACGNDVFYKQSGLAWIGLQLHYRTKIRKNIYLSIGAENSGILSQVKDKTNMTSWTAGVAMRLF
jgi:hypothetical protein